MVSTPQKIFTDTERYYLLKKDYDALERIKEHAFMIFRLERQKADAYRQERNVLEQRCKELKMGLKESKWREVDLQGTINLHEVFKHSRIEELEQRCEELTSWKREQLIVESSWDKQEVAREIGVPLGMPICSAILPFILQLKQENAELRKRLGE